MVEMVCAGCGREGRGNFCSECGAPMAPAVLGCPRCGGEVEERFKFCPECGFEMAAQGDAAAAAAAA